MQILEWEPNEGMRRRVETGIISEGGKLRVKPTGKKNPPRPDPLQFLTTESQFCFCNLLSTVPSSLPSLTRK